MLTPDEKVLDGLQRGHAMALEVRESEGKGRGLFAQENVPKGTYVCEYKTAIMYPRSQRKQHEEEYKKNDEGCFILEAKVKERWVCFDATRKYDSYGRYINHSHSGNIKPHRPFFVRGKYRVGFLTTTDVKKGDELFYDYGVSSSGIPWLRKDPPLTLSSDSESEHERMYNRSKYRKYKRCPIAGCDSKPQKKLSNHLTYKHPRLTKQERKAALSTATVVPQNHKSPILRPSGPFHYNRNIMEGRVGSTRQRCYNLRNMLFTLGRSHSPTVEM